MYQFQSPNRVLCAFRDPHKLGVEQWPYFGPIRFKECQNNLGLIREPNISPKRRATMVCPNPMAQGTTQRLVPTVIFAFISRVNHTLFAHSRTHSFCSKECGGAFLFLESNLSKLGLIGSQDLCNVLTCEYNIKAGLGFRFILCNKSNHNFGI